MAPGGQEGLFQTVLGQTKGQRERLGKLGMKLLGYYIFRGVGPAWDLSMKWTWTTTNVEGPLFLYPRRLWMAPKSPSENGLIWSRSVNRGRWEVWKNVKRFVCGWISGEWREETRERTRKPMGEIRSYRIRICDIRWQAEDLDEKVLPWGKQIAPIPNLRNKTAFWGRHGTNIGRYLSNWKDYFGFQECVFSLVSTPTEPISKGRIEALLRKRWSINI